MKQVLLDTDDLCVAEQTVSAFFGQIRMAPREGGAPAPARMLRSFVGLTSVDSAEFGYTFGYTMTPPDKILLARIHSGAMELRTEHRPPAVFGAGQVGAMGALNDAPFSGTCHRGRWDTFLIDRTYLEQVAAPHGDGPIRLTDSVPVSAAANRRLIAVMDYVRDGIAANPQIARNALIAGAAQRHLAAAVLSTYPNTAESECIAEDRRDSTRVLLRRAIAFIDDNAQRDISLVDIAEAIHVSPRAVQYMFRKHRDCTPMQYLRQIRLQHAHLDLIAENPLSSSVRNIAYRWGFAHPGRFSAAYRSAFGQSPHVTMRN